MKSYSPLRKPTIIRTTWAGAPRLPAPPKITAQIPSPWWFRLEFSPPVRLLWFWPKRIRKRKNWPKRTPSSHPKRRGGSLFPSLLYPTAIDTLKRFRSSPQTESNAGVVQMPIFPTSSHLPNGRPTRQISTVLYGLQYVGQFWRPASVQSPTKIWRLWGSRCSEGGTDCRRKSCAARPTIFGSVRNFWLSPLFGSPCNTYILCTGCPNRSRNFTF